MYYCIHCQTKTNSFPKSQVVCKTRKGYEYLQEICDICKKKSVFLKAAILPSLSLIKTAALRKKECKIKNKTESII